MKEVYGLEFYKKWVQDRERPFITQKVYRSYNSVLSFIGRLDITDTESFIYDLNRSIELRGNSDEGFFSDSVEDLQILYQYPNINIENVITIPMTDMKEILEEWLEFIRI